MRVRSGTANGCAHGHDKKDKYLLPSSVGIATELRAARSGDRIPVGRDFPPVQTGSEAHPASCTMGTGSFPGVKYGRGVLLTTHPVLDESPLPSFWATTGPVTGTLYLYSLPISTIQHAFTYECESR